MSISCDPNYVFSIDGHKFTIIEADGINTQPLEVDSIQIFAGQRYSFILNANQPIGNYWIRANPNLGTTGFSGGINSAILRYILANPLADPTSTQSPSTQPLVEANLVPLEDPAAPGTPQVGAADVLLNLNFAFDFANLDFTVNGVTFVPPSVPVLLQILSGTVNAQDLLPAGSVYSLPPNKVVELSMPAGVAGGPVRNDMHLIYYISLIGALRVIQHPFHLHGVSGCLLLSETVSSFSIACVLCRSECGKQHVQLRKPTPT